MAIVLGDVLDLLVPIYFAGIAVCVVVGVTWGIVNFVLDEIVPRIQDRQDRRHLAPRRALLSATDPRRGDAQRIPRRVDLRDDERVARGESFIA